MPEQPNKFDFAVGGQAVIEGVMMRSPNYTVISVRSPEGTILKHQENYSSIGRRIKFLGWPLVRGITNLLEMLVIGTKALDFSSRAFLGVKPRSTEKGSLKDNLSLFLSIVFALALSLFIFKFIPLWITTWLSSQSNLLNANYFYFNLIDAAIKITLFIGYLYLLSLIPDMRRVFAYHGAEHKTIMTYEQGLPLTVENAEKQTRFHPRCGTSFILNVFVISIFVFTVLPKNPDFISNFSIRLASLPLIAALSYEFLKWTSKQKDDRLLFKILTAPGLLLQRLTTAEPTPEMLEVAINSLQLSLELENEPQPL